MSRNKLIVGAIEDWSTEISLCTTVKQLQLDKLPAVGTPYVQSFEQAIRHFQSGLSSKGSLLITLTQRRQ